MARKASRTTPNLESQPLRGADFERAHSSVVLGEDVRDRRRGFTIVELLIVVVVIAILAAITIVAYNGITNRARAAAASSAAQQAAEKVAVFAIANSDQYPATLADAGVPNGSVTFQYGVDNTTTPRTFCVTATSNNVSYFASSTSAVPVAGACDGHGLNGEPTMTNLVLNPSVEINTMNWDYRWYGTGGGNGTNERPTSGGIRGAAFLRKTWTATGAGQDNGFSTNSSPSRLQVQGGTQYYVAASMRTNRSGFTPYIWVCWYDSSGVQLYGGNCQTANTVQAIPSNLWTTVSGSVTSPEGAAQATLIFSNVANSYNWNVGDTLDLDGAMLVQTPQTGLSYFDGTSPGWIWNGTPNNSTSTGPPL